MDRLLNILIFAAAFIAIVTASATFNIIGTGRATFNRAIFDQTTSGLQVLTRNLTEATVHGPSITVSNSKVSYKAAKWLKLSISMAAWCPQ